MSTLLKFVDTSTYPMAGPPTTYRDMAPSVWLVGTQLLDTDTAAGPDERPFRLGGTGPSIRFYSTPAATQFTLAGAVVTQLSGVASDVGFTGRFRFRLGKVTVGGSNIETSIGQADATADITTTPTLFTLTFTPATAVTLAAGERLVSTVTVIPTGAGGTSFGTGFATHRFNLSSSGMTLTETVTFPNNNGVQLHFRRVGTTGIGTFMDLQPSVRSGGGVSEWKVARTVSTAGGTEIQWVQQTQIGTVALTEIAAAAIASTSNASSYTSASFTPVAGRLYLLAVCHSDAAPETTEATISTTTGLAFVQLADHASGAVSQPFDTIASNVHKLTLFRAMKSAGLSAGTYTVNFADAATGCAAMLVEVTGVDTGGTDGSLAVRDVTMSAQNATANPLIVGNLPSGQLEIYNGFFACVGSSLQTAPTAATDWLALSDPDYATPSTGLFGEWKASAPYVGVYAGCTLASSNWAIVQVELVASHTADTAMEWISPRVKTPFYVGEDMRPTMLIAGTSDSDTLANCGMRLKIWHRAQDGTETLVFTVDTTAELTTGLTFSWGLIGTLNQAKAFYEDDRIVARLYLINVGGTMTAGHTCTLHFDDNLFGVHDAYFTMHSAVDFKLESDPAASMSVPGGLTMGGVGN